MVTSNQKIQISVITSLYKCESFLDNYFDYVSDIPNKEKIEILLLHNAPTENELSIIEKRIKKLSFVKHIIIPHREGLYATWNRGVKISKGKYLAVWNVDDIRSKYSLEEQAELLDNNPTIAATYGDFFGSKTYGTHNDIEFYEPEYEKKRYDFLRDFHLTCFPMWRKSIHSKIGYFDEQFNAVADFDFQIRLSLNYPLKKTNAKLGWYLCEGSHKISFRAHSKTLTERTLLCMRYGIFDQLNLLYCFKAIKEYKLFSIKSYNNSLNLLDINKNYSLFLLFRSPLIIFAFANLPINILKLLKKIIIANRLYS